MAQIVEIQLYVNGELVQSKNISIRNVKWQIKNWKRLYALHLKHYEVFIQIPSKFCK